MTALAWADVAAFIDGAGLAHVSTASTNGDPHVALVFAVREDTRMLFTMRRTSGKARNLMANPRVAMMWQGNSAETYLFGSVTIVTDLTEKRRVWHGGIFPFDLSHFYGTDDSDGWVVVHVAPERAVVMVQTANGLERRTWRA